jgi:hypothetical protein
MQARCRDAENQVAGAGVCSGEDGAPLDRADGEAGEVEIVAPVHAGHFRGFPADQRAPRLGAAFGHTGDHLAGARYIQRPGGEIIEEKERLRALHHQVVDAHGDQVDADRLQPSHFDGDPELGADPIGGGDQNGVLEPGGLEVEQAAEPAKAGHDAATRCCLGQRCDAVNQRVPGIDVDSRLFIRRALNGFLLASSMVIFYIG